MHVVTEVHRAVPPHHRVVPRRRHSRWQCQGYVRQRFVHPAKSSDEPRKKVAPGQHDAKEARGATDGLPSCSTRSRRGGSSRRGGPSARRRDVRPRAGRPSPFRGRPNSVVPVYCRSRRRGGGGVCGQTPLGEGESAARRLYPARRFLAGPRAWLVQAERFRLAPIG
jgi:hypothetical protein